MAAGRFPVVNGRVVLRVLGRAGFNLRHVRGSHHILTHPGPPSRMVSVPIHGSKPLKTGTLSGILEQAGLTVEEFMALL